MTHETLLPEQYINANTELKNKQVPFMLAAPVEKNPSFARAVVEHTSEGLEPMYTVGEARRTNGETNEELVFSAMTEAITGNKNTVSFLDHQPYLDTGVQVRFFDEEGTIWQAQGETFDAAAYTGLAAMHTKKSE